MSLPSIYVIGDSISIRYGPFLEKALNGVARYGRKEGEKEALTNLDNPLLGANGGNSQMVKDFLKLKIDQGMEKVDLLVVNCGLHDIKSNADSGELAISIEAYRSHLESIVNLSKDVAHAMLWVRTTPVDDEMHAKRKCKFGRVQSDVELYNGVADEVMQQAGIDILDLTPVCVLTEEGSTPFTDGVHFVDEARALQGAFIAGWITNYFAKRN